MGNDLFHLTACEKAEQVMNDGLKSDRKGRIFAFTDMLVANEIAKQQVFADRYSVFRIDKKGVRGRPFKDDMAGYTAPYQRIIKQDWIKPEFLTLVCTQETVWDRATEWDYLVGERKLMTKEEVDEAFSIFAWDREQMEKGELSETQILHEVDRRFDEQLKMERGNRP